MPTINRAAEILATGLPIYYVSTRELTHSNGLALAHTWADLIRVDFEHEPFDMAALGEFMRELVAGGPTASGHRTPPVIAELPTDATDGAVMRASSWLVKQVLA